MAEWRPACGRGGHRYSRPGFGPGPRLRGLSGLGKCNRSRVTQAGTRKEETHEDDGGPGADTWVTGAGQPERQTALPGRCAGRSPGSYPGPLCLPAHLPAPTAAEPLVAGEMDLTLRTGTDD
jgi:hypothetical protein